MFSTEKPNRVRIEGMSQCQLQCPGCPTSTRLIQPVIGAGYLKEDTFSSFLERHPYIRKVELSNFGELLLNPELPGLLKIAHQRGVALAAENGLNLNSASDELLEHLVRFRLRSATISIDGASPETYREYRVGGDWEKVIENIRTLNFFKKKYNSIYPKLVWQFVLFGHNEHELGKASSLAAELNMEFRPKLSWDDAHPIQNGDAIRPHIPGGVVSRLEYEEKYKRHYARSICYQLWTEPQLNWDGKLLGCCINHWGEFGGNAFETSLQECLAGDGVLYARRMLSGEAPPRDDIPCSRCDLYQFAAEREDWVSRREIMSHWWATETIFAPLFRSRGLRKIARVLRRMGGRSDR